MFRTTTPNADPIILRQNYLPLDIYVPCIEKDRHVKKSTTFLRYSFVLPLLDVSGDASKNQTYGDTSDVQYLDTTSGSRE